MEWYLRYRNSVSAARVRSSASLSTSSQIRGFLFASHDWQRMSTYSSQSQPAGNRENERFYSIVSQSRKEDKQKDGSSYTSHEQRSAADQRQNRIYDMTLSQIIDDRYTAIRLIRLKPRNLLGIDSMDKDERSPPLKASENPA